MMPPGLVPRASRAPSSTTHRPAPTGAPCPLPHPPSMGREAPPPAPSPRGRGTEDRPWRVVVWAAGCRGSCCEGHPARAPTVRSPAAPAFTRHNATTVTDPQSPNPGPLGPGRFYTNSPTPFGV